MSKTTVHVHHAFLYISLLSLHKNDVKWPHFKFEYGNGRISVWTLAWPPVLSSNQNSLLLSNSANSDNRENVWKDAKSIFERSFHGRCSLSDRKVANFVISRRMQFWDSYEIYRKAWCTFRVVVFRIKPIAFFMFPLPSSSFIRSLLKVWRRRRQRERQKKKQ